MRQRDIARAIHTAKRVIKRMPRRAWVGAAGAALLTAGVIWCTSGVPGFCVLVAGITGSAVPGCLIEGAEEAYASLSARKGGRA